MYRVLIVEDEPDVRKVIQASLELSGRFDCHGVASASAARDYLEEQVVDVVLLDWILGGVSGIDLLRYLRNHPRMAEVPVIMLTARGDDESRVHGLDRGADDYVVKPFVPRELVARIDALLRRRDGTYDRSAATGSVRLANMVLDTVLNRLEIDGHAVPLKPRESALLVYFMSHVDRPLGRTQLLRRAWGSDDLDERTLDVYVKRLRRSLESQAHPPYRSDYCIETVRGIGYRFCRRDRSAKATTG